MFERFTPYARRVIVLAEQEAATLQHDHIGTEHLLLGLTGVDGTPAAGLLRDAGVTRERTTAAVRRLHEHDQRPTADPVDALAAIGIDVAAIRRNAEEAFGPGKFRFPRIPFAPRAKEALAHTAREAIALSSPDIGTEHILLGILADADCRGVQVLTSLNVDPVQFRASVIDQIAPAAARIRAANLQLSQLSSQFAELTANGGPGAAEAVEAMRKAAGDAYAQAAVRSREVQNDLADSLEHVLATVRDALQPQAR